MWHFCYLRTSSLQEGAGPTVMFLQELRMYKPRLHRAPSCFKQPPQRRVRRRVFMWLQSATCNQILHTGPYSEVMYVLTFADRSRTPSCGSAASPLGGLRSSRPGWLSTEWGCWDEPRETSVPLSTSLCGDRRDKRHVYECTGLKDCLLPPRRSSFQWAAGRIQLIRARQLPPDRQWFIFYFFVILSSNTSPRWFTEQRCLQKTSQLLSSFWSHCFCIPGGRLAVLNMCVFSRAPPANQTIKARRTPAISMCGLYVLKHLMHFGAKSH